MAGILLFNNGGGNVAEKSSVPYVPPIAVSIGGFQMFAMKSNSIATTDERKQAGLRMNRPQSFSAGTAVNARSATLRSVDLGLSED